MGIILIVILDGINDCRRSEATNRKVRVLVSEPGREGARIGTSHVNPRVFSSNSMLLLSLDPMDEIG
jgi:hypothetical protein